ncbi:hypothetical protein HPB50_024538 [Hyalomma asiaticum]|uniref:Uncharacterized protein n=1 Tax=Hyalomma asiaticum TaxID=266040 RepID=A0ACB7SK95_HYAAI|nr:hypothetical protein HPB50_024538 [Hyalomma asiaticum]
MRARLLPICVVAKRGHQLASAQKSRLDLGGRTRRFVHLHVATCSDAAALTGLLIAARHPPSPSKARSGMLLLLGASLGGFLPNAERVLSPDRKRRAAPIRPLLDVDSPHCGPRLAGCGLLAAWLAGVKDLGLRRKEARCVSVWVRLCRRRDAACFRVGARLATAAAAAARAFYSAHRRTRGARKVPGRARNKPKDPGNEPGSSGLSERAAIALERQRGLVGRKTLRLLRLGSRVTLEPRGRAASLFVSPGLPASLSSERRERAVLNGLVHQLQPQGCLLRLWRFAAFSLPQTDVYVISHAIRQ